MMGEHVVDAILDFFTYLGTCCYPVWCVYITFMALLGFTLVIVVSLIDACIWFYSDVRNVLRGDYIKKIYTHDLYEYNRRALRNEKK